MRGSPAQAGRESPDHHGGTRAVRVVRELRAALSRRRRHPEGSESFRRGRKHVPLPVRRRRENGLRGHQDLAGQEDRRAAQCRNRRGDDRVLRQARAVARRAVDSPAPARHRPPGNLRGEDRARHEGDPRVDRTRILVPLRDAQVLGLPDGEAQDPCGGHRGRIHRPRDGGEPRASRVRRHPRRDGRSDPGAARSGNGAPRRGLCGAAWHPPGAQRRRGRIPEGCQRYAGGPHQIRQVVSGRHRDPRARRAPGHRAGENRRAGNRPARRDPRRRTHAHEHPGHLRRRRRRRSQGRRDRRVESHRARRAGEPAGPHRGRRDRRARLPLPRQPGHRDHRTLRRRRPPGPVPARRRSSGSATRTTRRSTSTRIRTLATTRVRSRSR